MKTAFRILLLAAVSVALSACAHQWTPEQLVALRAKHSDPCNYQTSGGGKCRNLWTADSGTPMPIELTTALQPER